MYLKNHQAIVIGCILTLTFNNALQAYTFFTAPDLRPYRWQGTQVITWSVSENAPAMLREAVADAAEQWSDSTQGTIRFAEGSGGISVIWDADGALIPDKLFLGYTYFKADGNLNITGATVILNAASYQWERGGDGGVSNTMVQGRRVASLDSVVLHELGHAIGLSHSDKNPAALVGKVGPNDYPTMNSIIYAGAQTLHLDDETGAQVLYGIAKVDALNAPEPLLISGSPLKGRAPLKTLLSAEGGDSQTTWDFGDGSSSIGASASHRFSAPGKYTVTASGNGRTGTVIIEVTGRGKKRPRSGYKSGR